MTLLYLLGEFLESYFGPFRLLTSRLFLGGVSVLTCGVLTFWLLPRLMGKLSIRWRCKTSSLRDNTSIKIQIESLQSFVSAFVESANNLEEFARNELDPFFKKLYDRYNEILQTLSRIDLEPEFKLD